MAEQVNPYVELAKYPLAVASIFLALVGAKFVLGIPFGAISKLTKDGVEFAQEAKGEIASLSAQVNAATKAIDEIKKQVPSKPLSSEAKSDIFEASQTVSNQTAQVATVGSDSLSGRSPAAGFIWIGDYTKSLSAWQRVKLVSPTTNAPLTTPPSSVAPGTVFTLSSNMVLRDGLPANDTEYFQGRRSLAGC
ncbi:hypothetical protein [Variovorax rhizosphaerae]|uniref:Uncharacterized protein n=1 Tax=Variovorax rhizosphaerae TaxID=1836200 RepID=A0ABU8WIH3_9BURK